MTEYDVPRLAHATDTISTGAQPTADGVAQLKAAGYQAVVNISPVSAKNFLNREASLTEKLGLIYVHFPVDCSNLQDFHYNLFAQVMRSLEDKKVFVHCGGNVKSSSLVHMYKVIQLQEDETESFAELVKIHVPEPKWFDYFKRFGMKGEVAVKGAA